MKARLLCLLCWVGWFLNRGGRFHMWAQWRYLDWRHGAPSTWPSLEELRRKYEGTASHDEERP